MMKYVLVFVLLGLIFSETNSWKFFHNGRLQGGNLGILKRHGLNDDARIFTRWFTQNLDQFDMENLNTWQQRYFVNDEFFDAERRNVAFLMIGGEGEAADVWMTLGEWTDYAKASNAILFQLEHRFYGESRPTENLSVENLKFLTSEQALADLAVFINGMNAEYSLSPDVKWIVFGGSYPGCLAAWARVKYSHLIDGAVSTSGPLLAVANFQDYFKVVSQDLLDISEECFSAVQTGTDQIEPLLKTNAGQKQLTELFQLCNDVGEKQNDISNFYMALADNFAYAAQTNANPRKSTRGTLLGNLNLNTICDIMSNASEEQEINRLANFNALLLRATGEACLDFNYDGMIEAMKDINWDSPVSEGARQWIFQTCNEFGFYQTSDNKPQIFGDQFPLNFFVQQCTDIFGSQFNKTYLDSAILRTNTMYGGLDIDISKVVFVHGSVDPWHALGITSTRSIDAPAIFINGTAHCANMYPVSDDDPPQLTAAREEIWLHIQSWLDF